MQTNCDFLSDNVNSGTTLRMKKTKFRLTDKMYHSEILEPDYAIALDIGQSLQFKKSEVTAYIGEIEMKEDFKIGGPAVIYFEITLTDSADKFCRKT